MGYSKRMHAGTTITEVRGGEAERFVDGLASLRIRVFRDFPYLYEGDRQYERRYLRTYFASPRAPGLTTEYSWREAGESSETPKQMQYWLKNLEVT